MPDFDFDTIVNRRGTNSYKWDSAPEDDILPLWVADMDFRTAPAIIEALQRRVSHGIFGYTKVPRAYYDATTSWFARHHGWHFNADEIIYTSGVVPAVSAIIKALVRPGDGVILQTPAYNCFFSSIRNNGCRTVENPLLYDGRTFSIDFDDLQRKAADPANTLLILCNPHNPSGRVWTRAELERIDDICRRNGVAVLSDEIHCELVFKPHSYIPFASLSPETAANTVTCVSPSKAFNIAGLQIANIVARNERWRALIDKAININEVCDVNPFGVIATIEAYNNGREWLEALIEYIAGNYATLCSFIAEHLPALKVCPLEGTYLAWVDIRALGMTSAAVERRLYDTGRVWMNAGTLYGADGEGYIRINLACPRATLDEALSRMATALQ